VGGAARALQNFGLSDLRVVAPGEFVAPSLGAAFVPEAYEYAVSAGWLLDAAARPASLDEALADATLVFATSARARDASFRVLTPRAAAAAAAAEARAGGRVAFVFGSERTGLRNEHLALAHACVAIPTAAPPADARSGSGGRYSLNLAAAVAVLAYEAFQAAADAAAAEADALLSSAAQGVLSGDAAALPRVGAAAAAVATSSVTSALAGSDALSTEARARLVSELCAARAALAVLARAPSAGDSAVELEAEAAERAMDARALARALSLGPLPTRDAAPLFALARRVQTLASLHAAAGGDGALLDAPVAAAARAALRAAGLDARACVAVAAASGAAVTPAARAAAEEARSRCEKALKDHFRAPPAALNLSKRELRRLVDAAAAAEAADAAASGRR
jgi:TrmH family RNA methyltransferase